MDIGEIVSTSMTDSQKWFPEAMNLNHMTLGLAGEAGEVANVVKKIDRGSLSLDDEGTKHDLAMEITDVLIYVANIAGLLGIDLSKTYKIKRSFNAKRFG